MQLEIEMKARVADPRAIEIRLKALGYVFDRAYRKEDFYFKAKNSQEVRVRLDQGVNIVTFKDKKIEAGLEINREHEFQISDSALMIDLLHRLGCADIVQKTKIGSAWRRSNFLAELSEIVGLGNYLEIERVLELPDDTSVDAQSRLGQEVKVQIIHALEELGLSLADIEGKTYTAMLRALKSAG